MKIKFYTCIIVIYFFLSGQPGWAQSETEPVLFKINRIVFKPGNKYAIYIPTFEFHMFFQRSFDSITSAVTADYDYRRQDMGFGMSHALQKYVVNPGVAVDDNLYFRKVFSDSTGIWRRKQSITPFLFHELDDNTAIGIRFRIEREWSPKRRMGTKIISKQDRSVKVYYLYQKEEKNIWEDRLFFISLERSYKILKGEFNYFLLEMLFKYSEEVTKAIRYKCIFNYLGNITPQPSPLYFLGGHLNLIGYENDEFWGRRLFYVQNLVELKPFPDFSVAIKNVNFRRISLLCQVDVGQVRGAPKMFDLKPQTKDVKVGLGTGVGVNTDLPYMPETDIYFIIAAPATDFSDMKYYAGFGGWID